MRIDENILRQARAADVLAFFEKYKGFSFASKSGEYRCREHPSLAIKADRLSWFWHSKGMGGYGVLDYLTKVENMPFRQAVDMAVTNCNCLEFVELYNRPEQPSAPPVKKLILPERTGVPLRLYDYLCNKRGIDVEIVNTLMRASMLYEDTRGNIVFVGLDECDKPRFASLRGTQGDCSFRGDCKGSDKRYGFNMSEFSQVFPTRLFIFESPIDAMSHASLMNAHVGDKTAWELDSRLSLAGTTDTALPLFLKKHFDVKELIFCLDNDQAGREATATMARKYAEKGFTVLIEYPKGKDFNEDLQAHRAQMQAYKRTKTQHHDVTI